MRLRYPALAATVAVASPLFLFAALLVLPLPLRAQFKQGGQAASKFPKYSGKARAAQV